MNKISSSNYWDLIYPVVTVHSSASATITVAGKTFTSDTSGNTQHSMPWGTFNISDSVSGQSFECTIDKNTTDVYVMPEGAIYWYGNKMCSISWAGISPIQNINSHFVSNTSNINIYSDNGNCNNVLLFDISNIDNIERYTKLNLHYVSYKANNSSYNYVRFLKSSNKIPVNGNYFEGSPNYLKTDESVKWDSASEEISDKFIYHSASGNDITYVSNATVFDVNYVGFIDWYMGENIIDKVWLE